MHIYLFGLLSLSRRYKKPGRAVAFLQSSELFKMRSMILFTALLGILGSSYAFEIPAGSCFICVSSQCVTIATVGSSDATSCVGGIIEDAFIISSPGRMDVLSKTIRCHGTDIDISNGTVIANNKLSRLVGRQTSECANAELCEFIYSINGKIY